MGRPKMTVATLLQTSNGFLCVTRKSDSHLSPDARRVGFPGGHVEASDCYPELELGKVFKFAAARELREETGIVVMTSQLLDLHEGLDDDQNWCRMFHVAGSVDVSRFKPEPGTEILALGKGELLRRCAWPRFYEEALRNFA